MPKPQRNRNVLKRALKRKQGGRDLYGIKQGVGRVTRTPFPKGRTKKRSMAATIKHALNAMNPCHLPLPRAVGGYTIIRTTDIVNTPQPAVLFGTFKGPAQQFTETTWLSTVGVRNVAGGLDKPINDPNAAGGGTGNAHFFPSVALAETSLNGARMVPAAMTVQIMGSSSLQDAAGIVYIGRSKTVLDLMGDTRSWDTVMKELVAYSAPRLCSAGKLSLRGVEVNAIPNNMSVLSDFVPRRNPANEQQVWDDTTYACDFEGFGPIFVYNPDFVPLRYLVTIEWRMRFDPLNPAYAGHVVHKPASESTWSQVISSAEALGHGVRDIADVAADVGMVGVAAAPFLM
ncbi:hypothetical protein [Beihai weivirus-like virus 11]|uniref:hypothetical protein n=1 Tax=Beihai weivirus-like virus 11 TaxID=1922740 RepID=UPI0009099E8A|nr:hypothetical protein [Beihai weivirus-like virus 11]APG78123.1 hypothetical protein [Beihai weivirus-like virus 11]